MAFRASKKPSASAATKTKTVKPKPETASEPEQVDASAASLSVDDFIGAPVSRNTEEKSTLMKQDPIQESLPESKQEVQEPQQAPAQEYPPQQRRPFHQNRTGGYGQRGYDRRGYQANRGGFRRGFGNQNSGRFGMRPFDGGGYRREWGQQQQPQQFEQDVNVPTETVRGILDCMPEGHGFLRPKFTPSDRDVYISQSQIRRFMLRNGDMVEGQARQPKDNERYWGLLKVEKVNEKIAEETTQRSRFEDLTPVYPNSLLRLETGKSPISTRIIDLVAPIGFGQRGLIVSPPKAGKTTILKEIAAGISANYPNVHLMAALIGERPEEVTDLSRSIKGEVLASNFDESPQEQTRVAEVALDRAKRLVEMGKDVVVLLDSITRLARAYNMVVNPSGRTLSGGFDPAALYPAKKFLGAARCVEKQVTIEKTQETSDDKKNESDQSAQTEKAHVAGEETGGSLTVIGTALVDTGSRMDDMIYEEFKGTGNMELHLSRILQERRIFPAIDIGRSGTRHDELLLGEDKMKLVTTLRHMLSLLSDEERTQMLVDRLNKTESNEEFLTSLSQG